MKLTLISAAAVLATLIALPAEAAYYRNGAGTNGISLNGSGINGIGGNGLIMNGYKLRGSLQASDEQPRSGDGMVITTITLADGTVIALY